MKNNFLRISVFLFGFLNIVNYFFPLKQLPFITSALLLYIIVVSLFNMPRLNIFVCGGMFVIASAIMFYVKADFLQWVSGLNKNGLLIALFVCGPLLSLPFSYENYQGELKNISRLYMHTLIPFALLIAMPMHIFAALTGFAALTIMYTLFSQTGKLYGSQDIFISTLVRSYVSSGFWGTSWVSVMLVVSELHIPWYRLIMMNLIYAPVAIAINLAGIKIAMLRHPGQYPKLTPDPDTKVDWRKVAIMFGLAVTIVLVILVINLSSGWNLLAIVPMVSMLFPLITALIQNKKTELKSGLKNYYDKALFKCRTEVFLFSSAGLLAHALEISGVGNAIPGLIPRFLISYPYFMIIALMLLVILLGQLGIHPAVTGTTLVAVIAPASIGLSVPSFALTIICAWLLSNMLSPFSALNLTMSGLCGKNTWYTGLRLNWRYAIVCMLIYGAMNLTLSPLLGNPVP